MLTGKRPMRRCVEKGRGIDREHGSIGEVDELAEFFSRECCLEGAASANDGDMLDGGAGESVEDGVGDVVVQRLVEQARSKGAERLWLLTTEADQFFAELGWSEVPRDRAQDAVRASRLYSEICPATAALMMRPLD